MLARVTTLDDLRPRTRALPTVVRRGDVGAAAWFALVRDGVLRPVWGDVAVVADLPSSPAVRGASLVDEVPRGGVVGRGSAAWVHAGGAPPPKVEVLVGSGRRRVPPSARRTSAEASLVPSDVELVGGLRVTTVHRTGTDVARFVAPARARRLLVDLVSAGFDPDAALRELDVLRGRRGVRQARALLRSLDDASGADDGLLGGLRAGDPVDVEHALDLADRGQHGREVRRLGHLEHEPRQRDPVA